MLTLPQRHPNFHAPGSYGAKAGRISGLTGTNAEIKVLRTGVRAPNQDRKQNVLGFADRASEYFAMPAFYIQASQSGTATMVNRVAVCRLSR